MSEVKFDSHYWAEYTTQDRRLDEVRARLASGAVGVDGFLALLRSDSVVAVGVALDHYRHEQSLTRFGGSNPYEEFEETVLEVARRSLTMPPYPPEDFEGGDMGLNHASALRVLGDLGDSSDASAISAMLRTGESSEVFSAALWAARAALLDSDEADPPDAELVRDIEGVVFDEDRGMKDRVDALMAFNHVQDRSVGEILARVARLPHPELEVEALALLIGYYLDTHLATVEEVIDSWKPEDVDGVRQQIVRGFDAAKRRRAMGQ
ncbi:hypothetical protein EOT10_01085 [Streptomyces antnestii]|uniref:Uncharacterized protein n=1 Tax=Streptomyces antnestii TaxID=2494256 RepID=A0A3S2XYK7_9ACTN|nr:hypothetical protein [Streptomyces sp. San01]RVU28512.1 hypothetical protein EOT10_01085 [Streptomyces sp. San01]